MVMIFMKPTSSILKFMTLGQKLRIIGLASITTNVLNFVFFLYFQRPGTKTKYIFMYIEYCSTGDRLQLWHSLPMGLRLFIWGGSDKCGHLVYIYFLAHFSHFGNPLLLYRRKSMLISNTLGVCRERRPVCMLCSLELNII